MSTTEVWLPHENYVEWTRVRGGSTGETASEAIRRKKSPFEGVWKLKSTRLCTSIPAQAATAPACSPSENELCSAPSRAHASRKKSQKNASPHKLPAMPVSASNST